MRIRQNLHIHSRHSCDSAQARMEDITLEMEQLQIEEYGVTDHLHTPWNLEDIRASRHDYLAQNPPKTFHFGIEASCVSRWELERIQAGDYVEAPIYGIRDGGPAHGEMAIGIDRATIEELGIEYVIGGVHWPLYVRCDEEAVIEDYFRQQLFLIAHPLVDILAHPWDSLELAAGDWYRHRDHLHIDYRAFSKIPASMHRELADQLIHTGKKAEINTAVLLSPAIPDFYRRNYLNMLKNWHEYGVGFIIGNDLHDAHFDKEEFTRAAKLLQSIGFTDSTITPFFQTEKYHDRKE